MDRFQDNFAEMFHLWPFTKIANFDWFHSAEQNGHQS